MSQLTDYVYDARIPAGDYVDNAEPLRVGVMFESVPTGPLHPALIRKRTTGKTHFYCVLRGLKVGIITDASVFVLCFLMGMLTYLLFAGRKASRSSPVSAMDFR